MCLSMIGQIIYGLVMLASFALTAVALFTPGWTMDEAASKDAVYSKGEGLMSYSCAKFFKGDSCNDWWEEIPNWQHVCIVCMWIALFAEAAALVWNLLTMLTCCFKKCLLHPIIPLALISAILLGISVIVYGVNGKEFVIYGEVQEGKTTPFARTQKGQLGYSFWLAVSALILAAADVVIGVVTVFFASLCC